MSKFNSSSVGSNKTTNLAGGSAYKINDQKLKLVTQVMTSFFGEPKFYGDNSRDIVSTMRSVIKSDAKFASNLALYAREVFNMRSITHVLSAELANAVEGKPFARKTIARVVKRPDDAMEIVAYYIATHGKPIPNSMKKGIADALKKFDEYQLAKYDRQQAVKLKDLVLISHPRPDTKEQAELFKKLLDGNLETPYTWETQLSTRGNTKEVWEELITSKKVGYMATLRNLRNIINSGATNIEDVYKYIENPNAVAGSKQLPFRFFSAYRELQGVSRAGSRPLDAIEKALELSVQNLPKLSGTTFMASDMSASMSWTSISKHSTVYPSDIASLLMSIAHQFCDNAITSVFATEFKVINVSKRGGILGNMQTFKNSNVGGGTYTHKAIQYLLDNKIKVDRIMIFSDCQAYGGNAMGLVEKYRKTVNPNVWVHSIDLAGYGTQQFNGKNTNLIAGWSDKVLEFVTLAEQGTDSLVNSIANYAE